MIIGAHSIIYSTNPDADRAFLRDVLRFTHVDGPKTMIPGAKKPAKGATKRPAKNIAKKTQKKKDTRG